jgi:hypothetical protein
MSLFRSEDSSHTERWLAPDSQVTGEILGYFNRTSDITQIRDAIIARYGAGVKITKDPISGSVLESYTQAGFAERVYNGSIEAISIGFGTRVVSALAVLFSEDTARFTLSADDPVVVEAATEFLTSHRKQGSFDAEITRADAISIQMASSVFLVEWVSGHLSYRAYDPGAIQVLFGASVVEDGYARGVRTNDLEDATCIILRTGTIDGATCSYLAVFAASEDYPSGRYCTYEAAPVDTRKVPPFGAAGCYDFLHPGGGPANPLTLYGLDHPDEAVPEYPICILYGGQTVDGLLPVSLSLYQSSLDHDVAASHIRSTSQDAARGSNVISRSVDAKVAKLPRSLVGNVDLAPGLTLTHVSHDAGASQTAWDILVGQMTQAAGSWGVPDYMASSADYTFDGSSGVALEIKTRALEHVTAYRRDLNTPAVSRLLEIEKGLIDLFEVDGTTVSQLLQCRQTWEFAGVKIPTNPAETADRVVKLKKEGVYDTIAAIRVVYGYETDEEAIAEYERMESRRIKYPPLVDAPKPFGGGADPLQEPGQPPEMRTQ